MECGRSLWYENCAIHAKSVSFYFWRCQRVLRGARATRRKAVEGIRAAEERAMYAQMVDTGQKKVRSLEEMSPEEQAFQQRVDADVKIEPKESMPEGYRKTLIRQI